METLVAILIVAVTSAILAMYIRSAAGINRQASEAFSLYSSEMAAAEARIPEGTASVVMNGVSMSVHYSGSLSEDAIHAYWRAP
jgi:hypothetical protein